MHITLGLPECRALWVGWIYTQKIVLKLQVTWWGHGERDFTATIEVSQDTELFESVEITWEMISNINMAFEGSWDT